MPQKSMQIISARIEQNHLMVPVKYCLKEFKLTTGWMDEWTDEWTNKQMND